LKDLVSVRRRYYTKKTDLPQFPELDTKMDAEAALEDHSLAEPLEPETAGGPADADPDVECMLEQIVSMRHARRAAEGPIAIESDTEQAEDPKGGDLPAATQKPRKPATQLPAVFLDAVPSPHKPSWADEYLATAAATAPAVPIRKRSKKAKGEGKKAAKKGKKAAQAQIKGKAMAKSRANANASKCATRPRASQSPSPASPCFGGGLRHVKATGRTYIQGRSAIGEGWKLVVEVSQRMTPDHLALCEQIRDKLLANPSWDKVKALSLRAEGLC